MHNLFLPASVIKLLTAIVALDVLGADYQFETNVIAHGEMHQGVLAGDLYLKGSGDPSLTKKALEGLVRQCARNGLKQITGAVHVDLDVFDDQLFAQGSLIDNVGAGWNSPISGLIVNRQPVVYDASLPVQGYDIETVLKTFFKQYGIAYTGSVTRKQLPAAGTTVMACNKSVALSALIKTLLKQSDNMYADCFFKKAGAVRYGGPGTWEKGIRLAKEFMHKKCNIKPADWVLEDGSGRSRYNAIAPQQLLQPLVWVTKQPYFKDFFDALPVSGVDGTLRDRMVDMPSRIHAKTGALRGVTGLAGYVVDAMGVSVPFCMFANGFAHPSSVPAYKARLKTTFEDAVCRELVKEVDTKKMPLLCLPHCA